MMGDGESAEGSVWEAMSFSSKNHLDNLVAIFDINRLGQSEETAFGHDLELYTKRFEGFGYVVSMFKYLKKYISGFHWPS